MDKIEIDDLWLEDALYISTIRSMVYTYSSPKINVWGNPIEGCFDVHIVFPSAGRAGVVIDKQIPLEEIHHKRYREVEEFLCKFISEIKQEVQTQIEEDNLAYGDDDEE